MNESTKGLRKSNEQDWFTHIEQVITAHRSNLSEEDFEKHRFDLLLRLGSRVHQYSVECRKCRKFHVKIQNYVDVIKELVELSDQDKDEYFAMFDELIEHLQSKHHLLSDGIYRKLGIVFGGILGLSVGGAVGQIVGFLIPGLLCGIVIGSLICMTVGRFMDVNARNEGRTI